MTRKGFTLIELLVVVAVLALLASIVFSNLGGAREGARISNALSFESQTHSLLGSDLIGWWNFDEGSGSTTRDLSGRGNDGVLHNFLEGSWADGIPGTGGYALIFNGVHSSSASRVSSDLIYATGDSFTLSSWIKVNEFPGSWSVVVGTEYGNNIRAGIVIKSNRGISLQSYSASSLSSLVNLVELDSWHHLLATYSNGEASLYFDGEVVGQGNIGDISRNDSVTIGSPRSNTYDPENRAFNGLIDDVRIYSRALTASEIKGLYAQTKDKYLANE